MPIAPLKRLLACTSVVLAGCASGSGEWHLFDAGYSIDAASPSDFVFQVHVNQLKQLGGDVNTPKFKLFAAERLKWYGMCLAGWTPLPCADDGSCIERTSSTVSVPGRCNQ
jgi:hypothetical protein